MNGFKLISSKQIIAEMYSDFNITNDDWINKAQRHMARALGIMKIDGYYERAFHLEAVKDFKAPLPCDEKYILTVLSNASGKITRLPLTRALALGADFSQIAAHNIYQGSINFNNLGTNFQEGTVMYVYYRVPKDDEGHLLIPDNDDVLEALPYFILYKLSLSGFKHPVISMERAEAKWRELYPRARNSMNYPSVEEMHRFTKMNTNPLFMDIINEEWESDSSTIAVAVKDFIEQLNGVTTEANLLADQWDNVI